MRRQQDRSKRVSKKNLVIPANEASNEVANLLKNKTGLQPVSRPVEQVHYFGG